MKNYQYAKSQSQKQQQQEQQQSTGTNLDNNNSAKNSKPPHIRIPRKLDLYFPSLSLCTDNGAMVAWTAVEKLSLGISDEVEGQEVIPRWPLGRPLADEKLFKKYN